MTKPTAGFRGQAPHEIFQTYMEQIVSAPEYAGMPDTRYEDGRIQWEAPSNRAGGQFKDSHHRRREWWARKAQELGINTSQDKWISRVAKAIHPTKSKPCKKCGKYMDIRYVYPNANTLKAVLRLPFVDSDFETSMTESIFSLVTRMHDRYGIRALNSLPKLLRLKAGDQHPSGDLSDWLGWIETNYVPSEPKTLSPGAMSNAPDRFEGFHSFNRCCRSTADTGRSAANLRSYTTDRRVFEYWTAGDWIAADRLMGLVRSDFSDEPCLNGHPGPCQADHIGPISLGFNHRPYFQLLCGACNSAKNNRMYLSDIAWLIDRERLGEEVISWHTKRIWDVCKRKVENQEHSLRLSKVLRDNRHSFMNAILKIAEAGNFAFLASLLELEHADFDVEFVNLKVVGHITSWSSIKHTPRGTKYAAEQKARRSRIAFTELLTYFSRRNRNAFVVATPESEKELQVTLAILESLKGQTKLFDNSLQQAISGNTDEADEKFRSIFAAYSDFDFGLFREAFSHLNKHMNAIGEELGSMWGHERFSREFSLELE